MQLNYKVDADTLLYASINRGYKGFNYNAGFAGVSSLNAFRFRGETIMAYEAGAKSDFLDDKIRLNAAIFYYDYSNYQAFDQRGLNLTLFNTDAAIYGADADLTVRPWTGMTFFGGVSLLHTKVKNVPIGGGLRDREATQSPHVTLSLAASQQFVTAPGTFAITANVKYTGTEYSQLSNAPDTLIPVDWLLNARVSFTDKSDRFEIAVSAKNLLNRRRQVYAFDLAAPPLGLAEASFAPPRQISGEITFRF